MNTLSTGKGKKPEIQDEMRNRWRRSLDSIVRVLCVDVAVIHRFHHPCLEVFLSSETEGIPFPKGDPSDMDIRLFCERVIKERIPILICDGLRDPACMENPAVRSGMAFCLGLPLVWPDGEIFGTVCVFDKKDNPRAIQFRELITEFQKTIEDNLHLLVEVNQREELIAVMQRHQSQLSETVTEQKSEAQKSKNILDESLKFDSLMADLSSTFLNLSPESVDEGITLALHRIRLFFDVDYCGLLEVLPNQKASCFLYKTDQKKAFPKALRASTHPWTYDQLVVRGELLALSSLAELPPEAGTDRLSWDQENVVALIMIPLHEGGKVTNLIGLYKNRMGQKWPDTHIQRLRHLGVSFARALIHKRDRETLMKSEELLAEAESIAHLGSWSFNISDGIHQWSDELYRIFGFQPQEFTASYEAFLASIYPDDRKTVQQVNHEAILNPEKTHAIEYRVVRPDGSRRMVHSSIIFFLDKGRDPVRMVGVVHDITEQRRAEESLERALAEILLLKEKAEKENIILQREQFRDRIPGIIGSSESLRYIMYRIQKVARTKTTVLLLGETGAGKGFFADALHKASDRHGKPFVIVNCAGLPPNLIESELFGREKGAFTGSTARQIGRFELANSGTIFLDEIGELPLDLQAKLLKVIEDEVFERLGSPHPVKVDVRIIASTNRNLGEEIKNGRFRKDLFYRLNVFPITIPPLRQRKADIAPLAEFFLARFSKKMGKSLMKIPKETFQVLEDYAWHGNVRELSNVIERSVIMSKGPELELADLSDSLSVFPEISNAPASPDVSATSSLVEVEREHIIRTLQEAGWKISGLDGAAQRLGLHPNTLKARMNKLGIKRPGSH